MSSEVLTNRAPARTPEGSILRELAAQANEAHGRIDEAARKNLFDALEAGQALIKAKKVCLGNWLVWVRHNFKGSARTAQRYMAFAVECHKIGGLDATRVSHLTPQQLGEIWTKLLREKSRREKNRAAAKRQPAPARMNEPAQPPDRGIMTVGEWAAIEVNESREHEADPLAEQAADPMQAGDGMQAGAGHPLAEREGYCTQEANSNGQVNGEASDVMPVDPMTRLAALFKQLLDGFRDVMNGDDEDDGPFAESMLCDLEPHYADVLEFLEDRPMLKASRAAASRRRA